MMMHKKQLAYTTVGFFMAVCCIGFLYQSAATYFDTRHYKAPGTLVDIGGYALHYTKAGTGTPAVVLDAGTGSFSSMWGIVPEEVSKFTQVYTYDRAGLGWSQQSPLARTSSNMVQELHTLIEKIQVPKPYILAGHSLGGGNVQLYADTYPDEVYGIVLVDAGHEDIMHLLKEQDLSFKRTMNGFTVVDQTGSAPHQPWKERLFIWATSFTIGDKILEYTGLKRLYLHSFYTTPGKAPYPVSSSMLARLLNPTTFKTCSAEIAHYPESAHQLSLAPNNLTNKPVIVIANGKGFFYNPLCHTKMSASELKFNEHVWAPLQQKLDTKSLDSKLIIAHKSGHRIQDTEPFLIVQAIQELVEKCKKAPL